MTKRGAYAPRRAAALIIGMIMAGLPLGTGQLPAAAEESGGKLLLLLDSSGSMKEKAADGLTKIKTAKTALGNVVKTLPAESEVGLRVYGATVYDRKDKGACTDTQLVVPIGTDNRNKLKSAIDKYQPYGETPIAYSLEQAATDLGGKGQRTILLVSDGEETCVPDPCPVAAKIAKTGVDLKIDVVGFRVSGKARKQLKCIADKGNGDYYDAEDVEDLERSLSRLSTRAFRPFRFSGVPITGSADPWTAPALAAGTWLDRMPDNPDAVKYYRLRRTKPGSTFWVGASLLAPSAWMAQLSLQLYPPDRLDRPCARSTPNTMNPTGRTRLLSGFVVSLSNDDACTQSDELLFELGVTKYSTDLDGADVELRVGEEPPVVDSAVVPKPAGAPTWQTMPERKPSPVIGGTSFSDAPTVKTGTYATDIAPGERQTFKIRADWGQRIQVLARTPQLTDADRQVVGYPRPFELGLWSPYGGSATTFDVQGAPTNLTSATNPIGALIYAASKESRWRNREGWIDPEAALAGDFFITVSLAKKNNDETPFAIPMTLTVAVIGEAQDPPPYQSSSYQTASPSPMPTPRPETPAPSPQTPTAQPNETELPESQAQTPPWVLLAVLAVLLLGGGAGLLIWLRRRS